MNQAEYFLKPNVQIEPLVNLWHAYPFVIAPATLAMVTTHYQLTTMKSYLKMPMAHVAALKNPDMVGGPFIDYKGKKLDEIRALQNRIEEQGKGLVELAQGIKEMNELLQRKAKGFPLEDLYAELPEVVRGYVELVYDLEHRATFRFIEGLLYKSQFFNKSWQSIALALIHSDQRPFIFSTPRLKDNNIIHLPISFDSSLVDELSRLKTVPQTFASIRERFAIAPEDEDTLRTLLTEEGPATPQPYHGDGVRVRYFGHACVLLESKDVSVLTDPLISYKYPSDINRFTYEDLPGKIDYVLITHAHHDHIVLETLLQLRSRIGHIVVPRAGVGSLQDPSMRLMLNNIGFNNVIEIDEMETLRAGDVQITSLPFYGEHCDLNIRSKSAYLVKFPAKSFLMAADSSSINPDVYRNVQQAVGNVDVLFVGMECTGAPMSWSYGSLFTVPLERQLDQVRRSKGSNAATGLQLIDIFSCSEVYLYAMGLEPWLNYFMALQHGHSSATDEESEKVISTCRARGIHAERLFASREMVMETEAV